ncbi:MAG: TetR/AcrR family transcriptional regulator [Rubrobacteraceae bacterium]|nr:TetR/AcrR family transcriptional regulator [Rubrobacter sp.]
MGSTRKAGRPKVPAADRILRAASEMFYREGIRAVGVDAIAAKADVTKKSLYDNFGSKDALIAAYLRARDERWRTWLLDTVDRQGGTAKERLLSTFDALAEWMKHENPRGCGFVNAAAELPHDGHPARAVVMDQKQWLRGYLAELAAEGGAADPESLAEQLMILHEGANVANSLDISANAAQRAREIASFLVTDLR